jgi:serine phosphatase RsbU (regulator of sigma subunit)
MSDPLLMSLLQSVPLFAELPQGELSALAEIAQVCAHPAGSLLFGEGDPSGYLAAVVSGEVEIIKSLGTPSEQVLAVIGSGEVLGEMSIAAQAGGYQPTTRSASARARQPVRCVQFPLQAFEELLARQPALAMRVMKLVVERTRLSEAASVTTLTEKNRRLEQALTELKASQAQLIDQEKMQHELRMARRIQESLLPEEMPTIPGYRLHACWQPARAVSGDFYDFIALGGEQWAIVIGDVTDKGVPASLVMTATRSLIRASAAAEARRSLAADAPALVSPGAILAQVNELLYIDIPMHMFVTCLFIVLHPPSGRLRLANAGHCLPLLSGAQGFSELVARGMPLGLMPGRSYEELEIELPASCRLLLYSDGLSEAHSLQDEMFGVPRLRSWVQEHGSGDLNLQELLGQVAAFAGPGQEQEDDMTLVLLERGAS